MMKGLLLAELAGVPRGRGYSEERHPLRRARDPLARGIAKGRRAAILCPEEVQEEREASSCKLVQGKALQNDRRTKSCKRKTVLKRKPALGKSRAAGEKETPGR
jgi:hypothetical protein